jgi:hypothetical protein
MAKKIKTLVESGESQQRSLDALVTVIKSCESSVISKWQEMAYAVHEIYTRELWTINFESFEHCMQEAIGWKKSWAYEMLKAANVLEHAPITDASMARYLHPLVASNRAIAWESAVESASPAKPTRDDVKKAASLLLTNQLGNQTDGEEDAEEKSGATDKDVPDAPLVAWGKQFDEIISNLRDVKNKIEELSETEAGAFLGSAQIVVDMKNVFNALQWAKPHCQCVYCDGDGCKHCQNRGWMCKGLHTSAPEDLK